MSKIPEVIPVSDLRQDAAAVLARVSKSGQPVIITQRGRATAVLLSVAAHEQAEHDHELLKLIALGEREVAKGKGHDLDDVLAEADRLLAQ